MEREIPHDIPKPKDTMLPGKPTLKEHVEYALGFDDKLTAMSNELDKLPPASLTEYAEMVKHIHTEYGLMDKIPILSLYSTVLSVNDVAISQGNNFYFKLMKDPNLLWALKQYPTDVLMKKAGSRFASGEPAGPAERTLLRDTYAAATLEAAEAAVGKKDTTPANGGYRERSAPPYLKEVLKHNKVRIALAFLKIPAQQVDRITRKAITNEFADINHRLNTRIANTLFMRDLEFMHDGSSFQAFQAIRQGKRAILYLLNASYFQIVPELTRLASSFNGAIAAKEQSPDTNAFRLISTIWGVRQEMREQFAEHHFDVRTQKQSQTELGTVIRNIESVKTNADIPSTLSSLISTMDKADSNTYEHMNINTSTPRHPLKASELLEYASGIFDAVRVPFQPKPDADGKRTGEISWLDEIRKGKTALNNDSTYNDSSAVVDNAWAMIANIGATYAAGYQSQMNLRNDVLSLGKRFFRDIPKYVEDVKRMEKFLGPYDTTDGPGSAKEQARVSFGDLPDLTISVRNLSFKHILNNVSLDIPQGTFLTIRGPSGSGKTTLMRSLMGLYHSPPGTLSYGGMDFSDIRQYSKDSIYSAIGYANQSPEYFPDLTVRQNILLWTNTPVSDENIDMLLSRLKLEKFSDKLDEVVPKMSGGELRRIGLARALIKNPKVLFLDEPTSNLDDESAHKVLEILTDLRKSNPDMTVIAITHDPNFDAIAERVLDLKTLNGNKESQVETVYIGTGKPD